MTRWARGCLASTMVLGSMLSACTAGSDPPADAAGRVARDGAIVVGSFDFSESRIIAEAYTLALEDAGFPVVRLPNVAAREIMEPALEQGFVDLVPEYQGAALSFLDSEATVRTWRPQTTQQRLVKAFADRGVEVLDYAPAENKNEVVVSLETAQRYGLRTISDLREHADDMIFGGPPECPSRPFCLLGLRQRYGLEFESFRPLDVGGPLTVAALDGGEVDVATLFTTNPEITARGFVVLEDDFNLQPSEHLVPVVRSETAAAHGEDFESVIDSVTEHFSTGTLRELNGQVEIGGEDPAEVARNWLDAVGLIR